jgi:phage gp45-like
MDRHAAIIKAIKNMQAGEEKTICRGKYVVMVEAGDRVKIHDLINSETLIYTHGGRFISVHSGF